MSRPILEQFSIHDAVNRANNFWLGRGYGRWESVGLISQYFPTQYNPSATHHQIYEILDGRRTVKPGECRFVIERVFRVTDICAVGAPFHLSLFEMLGATHFLTPIGQPPSLSDRVRFFEDVFDFLQQFGISRDLVYITYFGGGSIGKTFFTRDELTLIALRNLGLKETQLLPMGGLIQFLYPHQKGDIGGPRCDIYLTDSTGNPIEIATIDISYLILSDQLQINPNFSLLGFYTGLERLTAAATKQNTVWRTRPLCMILDEVDLTLSEQIGCASLASKIVFREKVQLVDFARSILFITSEGQTADSSARGRILRKLIADLHRLIITLYGMWNPKHVDLLLKKISIAYAPRFELDWQFASKTIQSYLEKRGGELHEF